MKPKARRLLASLLCMATLASGTITARAASPIGQSKFTDGDYELIFDGSSSGVAPEENIYFSDGLLLVQDGKNDSYVYLGEDGKIHDLNQGRFRAMFPFSEGLAAVSGEGGMGFIDTTGKLVIPCQFSYPSNQIGAGYGSQFHDGTAWTFRYDNEMDMFGDQKGTWTKIDKTGKLLPDTAIQTTMDAFRGPTREEVKTYNLVCPGGSTHGAHGFSETCSAPTSGTFKARFGTSDTGLTYLPTGKVDAHGNEETLLYVVKRKPVSGKLDLLIKGSLEVWQSDEVGIPYTITNNTGKPVKGYYALLSYWPVTRWHPAQWENKEGDGPESEYFYGFLYPFDVDLEQGGQMSGKIINAVVGWSTMTHIWITFDSAAERDAFVKNDALTFQDDAYEIDKHAQGIQWVKDNFGITIKSGKLY